MSEAGKRYVSAQAVVTISLEVQVEQEWTAGTTVNAICK